MKQNIHKTILVIVVGLITLSYVFQYLDNKSLEFISGLPLLISIASAIGLLSLLSNKMANAIVWLWEKLAQILGFINTRILLTALFYVFLVPIAAISRLFSKDPMKLKNPKGTVFVTRNHTYTAKDLENMW